MDHKKFYNWAGGIQAILLSGAIIVGGIWTCFFLDEKSKAELEIQSLKKQIEEKPSIDTEISYDVFKADDRKGYHVIISLQLKNTGSKSVILDLRNSPIYLSTVNTSKNVVLESYPYLVDKKNDGLKEIRIFGIRLTPKSTKIVSYRSFVQNTGIYLASLSIPVPKEDSAEELKQFENYLEKINETPSVPIIIAQRYIAVGLLHDHMK